MFGLFKKKSEIEVLQKKYEKVMQQWHALSSINRAQSDKKYAEAEDILKKIESLQKRK